MTLTIKINYFQNNIIDLDFALSLSLEIYGEKIFVLFCKNNKDCARWPVPSVMDW